MPENQSPADSHRLVRLAEKIHDKDYRDGYVATHTRQLLAKQMREFRGSMAQTEFADSLDKRQTQISRFENPSYSGWTVSSLLEIASKRNVAVIVRFVDFPTFLKYSGEQSAAALHPAEYSQQQVDDFARSEAEQVVLADMVREIQNLRSPTENTDESKASKAAQSAQFEAMGLHVPERIDRTGLWDRQGGPGRNINSLLPV